jgi:beta-lactam-binding protein with PASTA domain
MQVLPAQIAPKDDVRPPQSVTIPALIGLRYADAAQRLQGIAKVERRQRASSRPFDIVLDQSPGASVVPWPATVVLTVSDGSLVVVPRLQNGLLPTALELLKRQGLSWSVTEQDSSAPVGTVIGQAPEAGREVPRGTLVRLTVAKAPTPSSSPASPPLTGPMASMTRPPVAIPRVYVRDYIGAPRPSRRLNWEVPV